MQTQRTFIDDLKHQFKHGGGTMRLLFVNIGLFILINIVNVFGRLLGDESASQSLVSNVFSLHTDLGDFIRHPWGLFTSIFAHYSIFHLLFNMIFLYFSGRVFEQMFNAKRLFYTYLLGGIVGGIFEIIAHLLFPVFQNSNEVVIGASGSIMAIFFAIAFYQPQMKVQLFGIFPVRIILVAGAFLLLDFVSLGTIDGTAHFAHIGGAMIGMVSVQNIFSSSNLITRTEKLGDTIIGVFKSNRKAKMKVYKNPDVRREKDEDYNERKKMSQEEIDRILDKISKSGYESLTKKEKDFLFNQSKNG